MVFRKLSRLSFFSSHILPFSPDSRYFHKTSKRTIAKVSQVSHKIKDERNWRYCENCIVISSQSHKIVHEIVHEHVEMRDKCIASLMEITIEQHAVIHFCWIAGF